MSKDGNFKNPGLLYGYIPTLWICILFVVLFALSTGESAFPIFSYSFFVALVLTNYSKAIHLGQALYYHIWWLLPTIVLGCLGETIGWAGRLWSTQTPDASALNPYLMQYVHSSLLVHPLRNTHNPRTAHIAQHRPTRFFALGFSHTHIYRQATNQITFIGFLQPSLRPRRCWLPTSSCLAL